MTNFEKNNTQKHAEKKFLTDRLTDSSAIIYRLAPRGLDFVLSSAYAGWDCIILSSALSFKDGMPPAAPAEGLGVLA